MARTAWLILIVALQPLLSLWGGADCRSAGAEPFTAACAPQCTPEPASEPDPCCVPRTPAVCSSAPVCNLCRSLCRTLCEQPPTFQLRPASRPNTAPLLTAPTPARLALMPAETRPARLVPAVGSLPPRVFTPPQRLAMHCLWLL